MRHLAIALIFLTYSPHLFAETLPTPRDIISLNEQNKSITIRYDTLDYFLNRIAKHAQNYPPTFENDVERKEIELELHQVLNVLQALEKANIKQPDLLLRRGTAFSMGHNLNFKGAATIAEQTFSELLKLEPENSEANYHFGTFLASTRKTDSRTIPMLEKALKLGKKQAAYALGLAHIIRGDNEKGVEYLKAYQRDSPTDKDIPMMIKAIESGNVSHKQH